MENNSFSRFVGCALGLVVSACDGSAETPSVPDSAVQTDAHSISDAFDAGVGDLPRDSSLPVSDGNFFGASRCAESPFALCEDFEGNDIDSKRWTYIGAGGGAPTGGYAKIDDQRAARGHHSLHMHTEMNSGGSGSQVTANNIMPLPGNGFYLRAFMYFAQPIPDHHLNYFTASDPSTTSETSLGSGGGNLSIIEFYASKWDQGQGGGPLVVGSWTCLEWQVAPATSEVHVWQDEQEVPGLHATGWMDSAYTNFTIEFISYQGTYDIYIDELAYDTQRIGCTR